MAKPKVKSLQQKLGFFDDDLKSPSHDEILIWIDKNASKVIKSIYGIENWTSGYVEMLRQKAETIAKEELKFERENLIEKQKTLEDKLARQEILENKLKEELELEQNAEVENQNIFIKSSDFTKSKSEENKEIIESTENEIELIQRKIKYLEDFKGLPEELPKRKEPRIIERKWEYTITNQSFNPRTGYQSTKAVIGFIDMKIEFVYTRLIVKGLDTYDRKIKHRLEWSQTEEDARYSDELLRKTMLIEVKTKIPSLGELFRQLNTYKEFVKGDFIVICPDDTNKEVIESQGFIFYKYEK